MLSIMRHHDIFVVKWCIQIQFFLIGFEIIKQNNNSERRYKNSVSVFVETSNKAPTE